MSYTQLIHNIKFSINYFERKTLTCLWCETQLCVFYFQDAELRVLSTYSEEINTRKYDLFKSKVKLLSCFHITYNDLTDLSR